MSVYFFKEYLPDNTQLSSKLLTSLKRISESFIIASEVSVN